MDETINIEQFLKISNYESTVKQLDVYYGIGKKDIVNYLCILKYFVCS